MRVAARVSFVVIALYAVCTSASADVMFFGPKTYTLDRGQPQSFRETIVVAETDRCDGKAAFVLVIANGQGATVNSAVVALNEAILVPESAFKPKAGPLEVPIRLAETNSLLITIKGGNPGSSLVVSVRKDIEEPARPPRQYTLREKQQTFDDALSIGDPSSRFLLLLESGDAGGQHRPKSFSVLLNGLEVANEKVLLGEGAIIRAPLSLQTVNNLSTRVKGEAGDLLTVGVMRQLTEAACGPRIAIDTPAENALVSDRVLLVTGTASGPTDLGVVVNGWVAEVDLAHAGTMTDPFRWVAAVMDAEPGALKLGATARTGRDAFATASRAVVFTPPTAKTIDLLPRVLVGIAPFNASFNVGQDVEIAITAYDFDLDGDGMFEKNVGSLTEPVTHMYPAAGIYRATVRAHGENGSVYSSTSHVVVQTPATIDAVLQARWRQLRDALSAQDVEGALSLFTVPVREKYHRVYTDLFARLPAIAAEMQAPGLLSLDGDYADYLVLRVEEGRTRGYHVTFMRDASGIWKVAGF